MPRVGLVFDWILHAADAGQPGFVERRVVGASALAAARRGRAQDAEVLQRRDRLAKNRPRRRRTEHRHPAHAARAVVDVEVAGELRVLGLRLLSGAEVFAHVGLRAEQPLFLAAPQRHADGAPRLDAGRHQNARRLHHDRAADRVVGRAGGRMPRIEVPAEHDDFVGLVGARNFRDDVVARPSLGMGAIDDVELELDGAAVGEQAPDAAVVLVAHHDRGRRLRHVVARGC